MFLPLYFRPDSKDSMLWKIIGESDVRKMLFSGSAWLDSDIESVATEKHQEKKVLRERVKKVMSDDEAESDMWEQMVQDHMDADF